MNFLKLCTIINTVHNCSFGNNCIRNTLFFSSLEVTNVTFATITLETTHFLLFTIHNYFICDNEKSSGQINLKTKKKCQFKKKMFPDITKVLIIH